MPTLFVIDAQGTETSHDAAVGRSVMEIIRDAGLALMGECGGSLSCASCHVIVDPAWAEKLPPGSEFEIEMLDAVSDPAETSRLSCQIKIEDAVDGLRVSVPAA